MWQIADTGEFPEAPKELSPSGSAKLVNITAEHHLMWNGVPLENNNVDLGNFLRPLKNCIIAQLSCIISFVAGWIGEPDSTADFQSQDRELFYVGQI